MSDMSKASSDAARSPTNSTAQSEEVQSEPPNTTEDQRRRFLAIASTTAMAGGLVASYGTLGVMAGKFLYGQGTRLAWQLVGTIDELRLGQSMVYTTPTGATVVIARQKAGDGAEAFIALSSVCPHLGCQVYWEPQNDRFFCPCHNGAFDPQGNATEGPPAKAKQQLLKFPLKVEDGLLYIEVPMESIASDQRVARNEPMAAKGDLA